MIDLITDRTQDDVNEDTLKGQYNYTDYNRVEAAVQYVAGLLTEAGYVTSVICKTDWLVNEGLTLEDMNRYISNVHKCVDSFCSAGYELPSTLDGIDYVVANNIEKTLVGIEQLINYMIAAMRSCGTFYAGHMDGLRGYSL